MIITRSTKIKSINRIITIYIQINDTKHNPLKRDFNYNLINGIYISIYKINKKLHWDSRWDIHTKNKTNNVITCLIDINSVQR